MTHRLPAPLVRHLLAEVRANRLSAQAAALELNIHPSRLCQLRTDYLRACAQGFGDTWVPGTSGGDHHSDWPVAVVSLLTKLLSSNPPPSSPPHPVQPSRAACAQTEMFFTCVTPPIPSPNPSFCATAQSSDSFLF